MSFQISMTAVVACASLFIAAFVNFLYKIYRARNRIYQLKKQGLPMPPWNPILGHLYFCYQIASTLPSDAHPNYLADMIRRGYPELGPIYYLDTWPFGPQMLIVASTQGLHQITQEHSLPKYPALRSFLMPITEGLDIVTMEGDLWKTWRSIFNPGFSAGYLTSLAHGIVKETERFCEILDERVKDKKIFKMKTMTDNLTMDIIGRIVLNTQLDSQRSSNPLVDGLRMQIRWLSFGGEDINPVSSYNPVRPLVHWYNARRMDRYVSQEIDARVQKHQRDPDDSLKGSKSILDLVLKTYYSEKPSRKTEPLDSTFKKFTMSQVKLFLFAGHDTTSSTVCWLFHILASNPSVLERMRSEHDTILGPDVSGIAAEVSSKPSLLNQLPYTLAFIKETLRMHPAVSSTRIGEPGFNVVNDEGQQFPTENLMIWANPQPVHRDPTYWLRPDEFIPERWLVSPHDPLHPVKGAWRPFEHGPRNCIGQELAMLEMKVILVMTVRRFDIELVYDELDRRKGTKGIKTVYGERGYQISRAQPSGDFPVRVKRFGDVL